MHRWVLVHDTIIHKTDSGKEYNIYPSHLNHLKSTENSERGHWFYWAKSVFTFSTFWNFNVYFMNYWTNTRHVCTYLNAFLIVIPNIVMKFQHFDRFDKLCAHFWPLVVCSCLLPENIKNIIFIHLISSLLIIRLDS